MYPEGYAYPTNYKYPPGPYFYPPGPQMTSTAPSSGVNDLKQGVMPQNDVIRGWCPPDPVAPLSLHDNFGLINGITYFKVFGYY